MCIPGAAGAGGAGGAGGAAGAAGAGPIMGLFGIGSAVIQDSIQRGAINATNLFNSQQAELVRLEANRAAKQRTGGVIARRQELQEGAAQEAMDITRQAIRAAGIARLEGAGESVGEVLASITAQEMTGRESVKRAQEFGGMADAFEFGAIADQARGRARAAQRPLLIKPGAIGSLLAIGGAGLQGYMQGKYLDSPTD